MPVSPKRPRWSDRTPVSKFARFFRSYGIALGMIIAAIPFATKAGNLLPIYNATKDILTFSTSLLSFLGIAVLFGLRRSIGQAVFPHSETRCISRSEYRRRSIYGTVWPISLGFLAVLALGAYLVFVSVSLLDVAREQKVNINAKEDMARLLLDTPFVSIPYLLGIAVAYVTMFFASATAFVWLGLVEYLQSDLNISDADLITRPYTMMTRQDFKLTREVSESEASPYFYFEYDPRLERPIPLVSGPLCGQHHRLLRYEGKENVGQHRWRCVDAEKEKDHHFVVFPYDTVDASDAAREEANRILQSRLRAARVTDEQA
jgi:hypothetical protein